MSDLGPTIEASRARLLRRGVVILDSVVHGARMLSVSAPSESAAHDAVRDAFGPGVEVDWLGPTPRRLVARSVHRYREREPDRLQIRVVLRGEEHVDAVEVAEDEESVVVLATVCSAVAGESSEEIDVPCHVWLAKPLDGRVVIDGTRDAAVAEFVPDW